MMKSFRLTLLAMVIGVNVAGCAAYTDKRDTDRYSEDAFKGSQKHISDKRDSVTLEAKRIAQDVNRPYVTGKARPLSREVTLPAPLRGSVDTTMLYRDEADLVTLAARIQQATGILVKVMPDALLPLEAFMPRLDESVKTEGGVPAPSTARLDNPVALDSPLPVGGIARSSGPDREAAVSIPVSRQPLYPAGKQPLPSVLDAIALRLGVYWKYDSDIGALVFYRTETRTFEVRNAEMVSASQMTLGISGGIEQSSSSGLSSRSESSIGLTEEKEGPMAGIVNRVKQFMTQSGQIAAGASGLIVVTDIKTSLDQIQTYLDQENRMRSRRIEFVFEEVTVENTMSAQAGVNWDLMFVGGSGDTVNISGLNSLLEQEGAALSTTGSIGSGRWSGSSVTIQALSKLGKIVDRKLNTFGANNGQPVTTGRPERQKYISELEQTQSYSDNSAPTVSVTQDEEVSGRIITVVPHAYSDGDINLTVKYDNTPTPQFEKQTLPDGSYVQSPRSVSDVLVRTVTVRSGQPFIISAYTQNTTDYNERRVDRKAPMIFGGSDITGKNDLVTVLVLTAMVRE